MSNSFPEFVRKAVGRLNAISQQLQQRMAGIEAQHDLIKQMCEGAPSITEEIDSIPGRRIEYMLEVEPIAFTIAQNGTRGNKASAQVSQDGYFVQTHYPLAVWRPSAPANATNFGLWRPVSSYPLPDQATPASGNFDLDEDIISISYEIDDSGSQRNFQNLPRVPALSRPDYLAPLPVPVLFSPNSVIGFTPTFNSIRFSHGTVPPTAGVLDVGFPGYRIVNM